MGQIILHLSQRLLLTTLIIYYLCISNTFGQVASDPKATFSTTNTLTSFSVVLTPSDPSHGASPLPAGSTVTVEYQTSKGATIGTVTATVGPPATPGGDPRLAIPPPPIPAGAVGLGNQAVISWSDPGPPAITQVFKPVIWYDSSWTWGITPSIKIDPFGLPGITSTQSWFIQDATTLIGMSTIISDQSATVIGSNFDLRYTPIGTDMFSASIVGDNSFIYLNNNTYISIPPDTDFGTLRYLFNDGIEAGGTFDFFDIGLSGIWNWDSASNYTGGVANSITSFNALAITATVPEPSSLLLLAGAVFGGLVGYHRSRRKQGH